MPAVTVIFSRELYGKLEKSHVLTGIRIPEIIKELVDEHIDEVM